MDENCTWMFSYIYNSFPWDKRIWTYSLSPSIVGFGIVKKLPWSIVNKNILNWDLHCSIFSPWFEFIRNFGNVCKLFFFSLITPWIQQAFMECKRKAIFTTFLSGNIGRVQLYIRYNAGAIAWAPWVINIIFGVPSIKIVC